MIYLRKDQATKKLVHSRLIYLMGIIAVSFFILLMRIGYLQILRGDYFRACALENSIQLIPISAPRGMIFDRHGEILVKSRPLFNVAIIRGKLNQEMLNKTCAGLVRILDLPELELKEKILKARNYPFRPAIMAKDVDIDKVAMIEENKFNLPGVIIQAEPFRTYVHGELAAHVLGYLGEIGPRELTKLSKKGYEAGDVVGKFGLEKFYDQYLRGEEGGRQIEVNARGERLRSLGLRYPIEGRNLTLTIDKGIQMKAEEVLGENRGVVVVMEVASGEILALVSSPGFDPNLFLASNKAPQLTALLKDPLCPFLSRTTQAQYPPGSLFKIIVALAALEGGLVDPRTSIYCPGHWYLGNHEFKCWNQEGHGRVDLISAITHSCNVFFYQLGQKVGVKRLSHFAQLFGLGEESGIDLLGEKGGLVPTPDWKRRTLGDRWYSGDTVNLSIGQSFILVTPLQMAGLMGAVANGGRLYRPHLVKEIRTSSGKPVTSFGPELRREIHLSKYSLRLLRQGLEGVVREGTGQASYLSGLKVAGKTGTAENPHGKNHAWFASYAPAENPRVAIVVLVEHGGMGGGVAAPMARPILEEIFSLDKNDG